MIRKCKLCGAEFEGVSRDVKCPACRKISAFAENGSLFVDCYGKQNEIAWRICREDLK